MKVEDINKVKVEIKRMQDAIARLEDSTKDSRGNKHYPSPSKQVAAVKRVSMDLTNALVAIRKSRRWDE